MEYSKDAGSTQFDFNNIQKVLIGQLKKSRQQSPESFSKEIYVLPAVNDDIEHQLEQQLQQELEDHKEKRIILIPYCLENSHWIGILIEFQAANQVLRAEYIDPIIGSNAALYRLQKQLIKIYPSTVLQPRNLFNHTDRRFSSALTVKNLLTAVETDQRSSFPDRETRPTDSCNSNKSDANRYSTESTSASWSNNKNSISTSTTSVQTKGNDYKLDEMEQELNNGLGKFKIRGVDMLPQKIQKAEERIREYEEEERTDDVDKETAILRELQQLQNLVNEIASLKYELSMGKDNSQSELQQLKEELTNGLAKLKIRDVDILPQKIQKTEERIKEYEEEERIDDVEKETAILKELQRLQNLANQITRLSQEPSHDNVQLQLRRMKEDLTNGFAKLKIRDEAMLPQKIQKTQERIKEYEEEERTDDVEKETVILKELQRLQNLANEIARLSQAPSTSHDGAQLKLFQMKEEVSNGFKKLKIRDQAMLSQKIQKTQERIKDYEDEERTDDVEKETTILKELQRLQNLVNEVARLTEEVSTPQPDDQSKLRQMKEEVSNGFKKLKIRDEAMLSQKIQKTQERIKEYEDEERTDDAEKETTILKELQRLQNLVNEVARLTEEVSTPQSDDQSKLRQMKEEVSNGFAKLKIRDEAMLSQKIQKTQERIKDYEEEERIDDVEKETTILKELQRLQNLLNEIAELTKESPMTKNDVQLELIKKKEELTNSFTKLKIRDEAMLLQKIQKTQERIREYEEEERTDDVEKETAILKELQRLQNLANEIARLTTVTSDSSSIPESELSGQHNQLENQFSKDSLPNTFEKIPASGPDNNEPNVEETQPETPVNADGNNMTLDDRKKKFLYINDLRAEADNMPACARKTVIELLVHFEQKLLGVSTDSQNQDTLISSVQTLKDQIKREELLSDDIKPMLHSLETHIINENYTIIVRCLNELLKKLRSLNVSEIQRLVAKAKQAAELIRDKDIVLLIGTTGSGKSTTIQFLAGAKMKQVQVETSPGRYLDHVTAVEPIKNPDLKSVISSPLSKSETRYILPVTIPLKDILGAHESGVVILCDAPGFGDTAGPEVDIANSIGVIEALKGANSVKLLALSSFQSLGDRGQGIQKLAHMLIRMVHGIKDKLDAIVYAFTKYPEKMDINARLVEIKKTKVDEDSTLQADIAFVSVLIDMIEKTEDSAFKIEPIKDEPKKLLRKLKSVYGLKNPAEVFRFSMSEETRTSISDHVQRDKFSIICAMKHKDHALVLYYLNDIQTLKDLIKESFIREAYEESVRFVGESIRNYCAEIQEKFNRALASQDGLQNKDILDYRTSSKYLEDAQILKEHLESSLLSPASMLQNVITQLNEISRNLDEEELHSPLVTVYLQNLCMLKNSFPELEESYKTSCKKFQKRFDELIENARELIPKDEFKQIAEILFNIFQSVRVLKNHLHEQTEEAYSVVIRHLLRHLNSFSEKAEPLLARVRLSNENIETIKNYIEILRSAKENAALQERVSKYLEMLRKKVESSDEHEPQGEKLKDLNEIYDEFIAKIIKYFDEINQKIKELFERNGDQALEHIQSLVKDMDALRTIPELESKTAGTYYHTVENIRGYMQQLQADAEKLVLAIDQQTSITNYKYLARSLARLKNAEWINQASPGTYESLMRRITEDLVQYASQLEESLMKIDFSLKYPDNVSAAKEIVEKIESMRDLERSVPELEKHRTNIVNRFLQCTQGAFDRIQKTFCLQDNDVYLIKQKLRELEEIKRQYESLHPARIFLQKQGYADINMLNKEIEDLKAKQQAEREAKEVAERDVEAELNKLNTIVREYMTLSSSQTSMFEKLTTGIESGHQNKSAQADAYLQKSGYKRIDLLYDQISKLQKIYRNKSQQLEDQNTESSVSLHRLESIKREHDSLLATCHSSPEEASFLREKGFNSYESMDEAIQEKTKVINERGKNKQTHHFSDRLDAATANNAIVYINQCGKVGHDRVRENAIDANDNLRKYIQQYGIFLQQEINRKFVHIRTIDAEGGPFSYSQDLEMRLQELSSFERFPHVFECINGTETIEQWRQQFLDFHRSLSTRMEDYNVAGKIRELRDQLLIAQALTCVDRFCVTVFAGNGFAALYRQYQGAINKECRVAYRKVLDHISEEDYGNADMALSDIEDNPLNPRDKAQIENDLQSSLNKLMKDTKSIANWLDGKIEREDNRSQIKEIRENIDKIRIACNKRNILDLLDPTTRTNLQAFDNEINEILAGIILRGLKSIEAFMKADSFSEAEQGMETLSQVERALAGYCTSEAVKEKGEELRGRLDSIVSEVLERNEFADVNKFSVNPPKELLGKLETVAAHGSARFTQAYRSMLSKIRQTFNLAIEEVRKVPLNERSVKIRSLTYALYFLPEDLQIQYKLQIDELNKLITDEEKGYREDLERSFTNVDEDEHAITKIGRLAEQYSRQNMHDLLKTLREQCLKKLHMYRTNIQKSLDEQNIQSTIDTLKKIVKYEEYVGAYIPEIKVISENVRILSIKRFFNCCETLSNISTIEQTSIVEKAFTDTLIYLEFSNTLDKKVEEFFPDDVMQHVREAFQKISDYLIDNSEKFRVALKDTIIIELHKSVSVSKKWQKFSEKIRQCSLNHNLVQNLLKEMKKVIPYGDMVTELEQMVERLKSHLNVEFISDETTRFEGKRDEFFKNLADSFNTLKTISMKFKDVLSSSIDIDKFEKEIKLKVEKIKTQLMNRASRPELASRDADDFRMYYNHLVSFNNYVRLPEIDIQQVLEESRDKIFAKVDLLNQQIKNSIKDAVAVSATLVKIKFFAENLSMFEKYINDEIDNALKHYKASEGTAGITRLSVELEKSEVGARLIAEHSSLSGEDWRKRREKMQKQDDLEYMLDNLTGDKLSTDILRARYKTFKDKYNQLISTFLKTLKPDDKQEPDLEVLISQTKLLVGAVTQTPNSVTWTRSFKDDIPILLAHIFAVWTLKNTQHYNSMRGVDEANSYLLMPHVGQVIAIFRLLGIGYEEHKKMRGYNVPFTGKISDDLVNNLVEVGTGEGKSVVMAITACVFALTGVDVNCSCYSEVLSTRDKSDFASVFRALGIEDRIEYGTFNKLCEQLLNQQCNVREKVREMIVNNQSTLAAVDTASRLRPKILLIDEVDVFLSDKYYGGVYIPSVYLKDPSIKALIDSIWQNKTLRSLNSVKALPAYQICSTKYSHWIFLFDEAIKDMLAALQSYQSSTYIVQNDKIVYVVGESVVDNVVRGYDTVWAYYHENGKGNISANSLGENVGILINCGTFSYAEIPHDFAYIGGVTGTLRTLAKKEKEILEKVYAISKNTFIPSVFGSSNRTFNPMNDVRVVKESEYFMEIHGEIRAVCNANRTILVFFESEEKLLAFYNSPDLSAIKQDVQIITEKVSVKERELCVKRAATVGKVTLLTRTFGRGTDFICRNQQLLVSGGIHVLQTFFSEELSEEYQIMGRGARQGDRGSYRMILLDKDLEWLLGPNWKEDLPKVAGTTLYEALNKARSVLYESKCGGKDLGIEQCKADHIAAKAFMSALTSGNIGAIKEFLGKQNKGANLITASSRTVLLMDATGSMSSLLSAAKETVCTMFERASTVLTEKGLPNDAFQMQFAVYRNYSSDANKILQVSSWNTKASNLREFMKTIGPEGGMGNEAIEIGLWHAATESETQDSISQVILIGDAPANSQNEVTQKRTSLGENYWKTTRFNQPTYYTSELKKLKDKNIPVHAFYLTPSAKNNFVEIARETSGRCQELNIYSSEGAESLTHFVTEEVLRKTAGDQGDAVVKFYRDKYVKTAFTS